MWCNINLHHFIQVGMLIEVKEMVKKSYLNNLSSFVHTRELNKTKLDF